MVRSPSVVGVLERIATQPTAPFHEHAVLREAAAIAARAGANVRHDPFGNLVVAPPGTRRGPPIWLVAHTDHPGFDIVGPRQAAFRGGVRPPYFRRGTRLRFYREGEAIPARIAKASFRQRRIRVTLAGRDAARLRRGDFGVWELEDFRVARGIVHARQLDDLAGCAVSLAVVLRACRDRRLNVRALLTRAEEVGFVGSLGAAESRVIPRNAWIVNVEASRAIPGVEIGGGPVIRTGDRTRTFDPVAENLLLVARAELGERRAVQRATLTGGTCEATPWVLLGYRATGVAIPLGNYHNQGPGDRVAAEFVAVRDLETAVDLLEAAARNVPEGLLRDDVLRRRIAGYLRSHGARLRASRPKPL